MTPKLNEAKEMRSFRIRSVRSRVTTIAVVISAVGLTVASVILIVVLQRSLLAEIDRSLSSSIDELVAQVESENELIVVAENLDQDTFAAVLDGIGDVYGTSDERLLTIGITSDLLGVIDRFNQPFNVPQAVLGRNEPGDLRFLAHLTDEDPFDEPSDGFTDIGEEDYVSIVGISTASMNRTVASIRNALLVGVPLLVGLIGVLVWWLTGRAIGPVERIRAEVAEISGSALNRRIADPESGDEIERLATTMNEMLDRLETSQEQQRRFVSDASHELRSPLAAISTRLEVEALHGDSSSREHTLSAVRQDAERLRVLVDDLLTLARSEGAHVEPRAMPMTLVDLDDLIFQDIGDRQSSQKIDASGVSAGTIRGIEGDLARLVHNLVDNAVRHCSQHVWVSLTEADGIAILRVDDDGTGIDPDDRNHIFERFVRLDQARSRDAGGSGLGLAICREIAHAHGAAITVDSSPRGGARFEVEFPSAT